MATDEEGAVVDDHGVVRLTTLWLEEKRRTRPRGHDVCSSCTVVAIRDPEVRKRMGTPPPEIPRRGCLASVTDRHLGHRRVLIA